MLSRVVCACLVVSLGAASQLQTTLVPLAIKGKFDDVTYGNGLFVAVGTQGDYRVMTSQDGITWTPRVAAEANSWKGVAYGNGLYVAVSSDGTNRVMTSQDGITWTSRPKTTGEYYAVSYGNGFFIAVGKDLVSTSSDGITWTDRSIINGYWNDVVYGNGNWVTIQDTGSIRVATSPDGITWTTRTAADVSIGWISVTYGNGLYVAVATTGTGDKVMTSPDGITWTIRSSLGHISNQKYWSVRYGDGHFVAFASAVSPFPAMSSTDGITWDMLPSPKEPSYADVGGLIFKGSVYADLSDAGKGKIFVAVGESGVVMRVYRSSGDDDLRDWEIILISLACTIGIQVLTFVIGWLVYRKCFQAPHAGDSHTPIGEASAPAQTEVNLESKQGPGVSEQQL